MDYANVATGSYLVVNNRPCKVVKLDKSTLGRHGKSRKHVTCADLITDKKIEAIFKKSSLIDVPLITKDTF